MGERLPSERNLQVVFQSSRGVIREALGALKQKGLIEIKKGAHGGAIIKKLELNNASEPLALFLSQQQIQPELLIEFRESMDRTITLLAISRGSTEDKQALLEKSKQFIELFGQSNPDLEQIAEIDREMNIALAQLTGNPIFEIVMRTTQVGFNSQDQVLYKSPEYQMKTAVNWGETAKWVAEGEPMKALSCISHHYAMLRRCLSEETDETAGPVDFSAHQDPDAPPQDWPFPNS